MPRLLLVTSMFLPYLAADVHRARLLAAELPQHGWDVEVLVPGDSFQRSEHLEPNAELLSVQVPVHRAVPEWHAVFRMFNSQSLGFRAYRPLQRLGNQLLSKRHFDLVYFCCSQPMFFHLGVGWRKRNGVPFILDLHDPWYSPNLNKTSHLINWKRRLTNNLARLLERATIKEASGLVSVSPKYLETVNRRYRSNNWAALSPMHQATIPFGACEADFLAASELRRAQPCAHHGGTRTIVYTGAGGVIMEQSFREICRQLNEVCRQAPHIVANLQIKLFGTEPAAAGGAPVLSRVIHEEGLNGIISEHPERLSYLQALKHVKAADGLLVMGVDDAAYMPSKLFLYAMTGKPVLTCMRTDSVVNEYFNRQPGLGYLIQFGPGARRKEMGQKVLRFIEDVTTRRVVDRQPMLAEWLAPAMARRHIELFERCLASA